ncbi:fibronectin type III domain-containing protein [Actinomadura sp. GC306]|uniref:fibronectin type III domain-containing protein n=1 Tax=Actinomadura sp. GC306 TaxID=2530367 RepID=UPI001405091F|nr:fibronectin type III domain-containing protein [Actinomadura sp. GC306]
MRTAVQGWFRRDRLTGQVAAGLVGVLVVAAAVYGVGIASAEYRLADVGAWLTAKSRGAVVHVNGPAAKVDGKAGVIPHMRGHNVKIVQDGATILIVDLDTGVVSRLDPSQLSIGQSRSLGRGVQVLAGAGKAYTVDSVKGVVQQIDPVGLTPVGASATLPPVLGQAGVDGTGTLWVPVSQKGEVAAFRDGALQPPVRVGAPGAGLALTIAAGHPVVTDSTAATATVVRSGSPLTIALPTTVRRAGRGGVLAPAHTEGRIVPLLVPGTGSLVTVDTDTGRYSSARLPMPRHRYRPPQVLGAKVYIPDETAGALIVYDSAANRFDRPVPVTNRPARLDVFVKDGLLWANDPAGPNAVVVDRGNAHRGVDKYRDRVAGGPRRRTIPLPGDGDAPPSGRPSPRGTPAAPPSRPAAPGAPPSAPGNVSVAPGAGTMRIDFQPSRGDGIAGYVLKDVPSGLSVSPSAIAPGAGPFTFTVAGGDCGTEYRFRVAVRYRDGRGRTREVPSAASDPVRPCVTPGTPTGLAAKATASGAQVSWTAAPGGGSTSYRLTWTGPVSGGKTVTATSATLADVWSNGDYTFSVTPVNGAGTGAGATLGTTLTGPAGTYAVTRNGGSDGYIKAEASHTSSTVATMRDNNGENVTVHCKKQGSYYQHPSDSNLAGDMYTKITWQGHTGYVIGYLVGTPGAWTSFSGPAVWKC